MVSRTVSIAGRSGPLPRFVVFGEALTDLILSDANRWLAVPGGSCWNVARVGARLGIATGFAGAVSQDLFGDELARESEEAGLDGRFLQRVDAAPLLAIVPSTTPPRYFFIGAASADLAFDPALLPSGWRESVALAHFGGISLARPPLAECLVEQARGLAAAGKQVAFDPNFRDLMRQPSYAEVFRSMATLAAYIKVSDEDLRGLFPGLAPGEAMAALRALAPQAVILLTRGAEGLVLSCGPDVLELPAFPVRVVDTVGCGDAAMGGWLASVLSRPAAPSTEHLRMAAATAALAASHAGPYAPTRGAVDAFLRDVAATRD